jgi:hypothetical protein
MTLTNDGVPCEPFEMTEMTPDDPDPHYFDIVGNIRCAERFGSVVIRNQVLFDHQRDYVIFTQIHVPRGMLEGSFTAGQPSVTIEVYPFGSGSGSGSGSGVGSGSGGGGGTGSRAEVQGSRFQGPGETGALDRIAMFMGLGVGHIIGLGENGWPRGLDHILFVIGFTIAATSLRRLLVIITAFTIAHSMTLALSSLGVIAIPGSLTESLIALSVAYVGIENLVHEPKRRWALAIAFGLIHGLGFSSVLSDLVGGLEMSTGQHVQLLLGFNVGVEIGQLAVVCAVYPLAVGFRKLGKQRGFLVIGSAGIAAAGIVWFIQRAFL